MEKVLCWKESLLHIGNNISEIVHLVKYKRCTDWWEDLAWNYWRKALQIIQTLTSKWLLSHHQSGVEGKRIYKSFMRYLYEWQKRFTVIVTKENFVRLLTHATLSSIYNDSLLPQINDDSQQWGLLSWFAWFCRAWNP